MARRTRVGIGLAVVAAGIVAIGGMLIPTDAQPVGRMDRIAAVGDGTRWLVHIPGVEGDVAGGDYDGWHSARQVTWGAAQPAAANTGGGRARGAATMDPVRIEKGDNLGSPAVFAAVTRGNVFPKIEVLRVDRNGQPRYRLTLTNARITRFAHEAVGGRDVGETIELGYEKIEFAIIRREGQRESSATYDTERSVTETR